MNNRFWTNLYLFFCVRLFQVRWLWWLWWLRGRRAQPRPPPQQLQMQNLNRGRVGQRLSVCGHQEQIHLHLTLRRFTQKKPWFLFLSTLETDRADDLRGRGDKDPAVDWQSTRGLSTVLDALWSHSSSLVRPPQVGLWKPAFRPTAHIHHVTVCPLCWQTQRSSCFCETTEQHCPQAEPWTWSVVFRFLITHRSQPEWHSHCHDSDHWTRSRCTLLNPAVWHRPVSGSHPLLSVLQTPRHGNQMRLGRHRKEEWKSFCPCSVIVRIPKSDCGATGLPEPGRSAVDSANMVRWLCGRSWPAHGLWTWPGNYLSLSSIKQPQRVTITQSRCFCELI